MTDVMENHRDNCLATYGLDPVNYFTTPSFAFDAMLKITDEEIELIQDMEMINFIKDNIRGGLSQVSQRKATAKNKYAVGPNTSFEVHDFIPVNNKIKLIYC